MTLHHIDETNPLENGAVYHEGVKYGMTMTLAELAKAGGHITRLRVLSDYGRYDISYCHAALPDGTVVPIRLDTCGGWLRSIKGDLISWAQREGVHAKKLGLLDESNWSILK